jgi:hypothetical protein
MRSATRCASTGECLVQIRLTASRGNVGHGRRRSGYLDLVGGAEPVPAPSALSWSATGRRQAALARIAERQTGLLLRVSLFRVVHALPPGHEAVTGSHLPRPATGIEVNRRTVAEELRRALSSSRGRPGRGSRLVVVAGEPAAPSKRSLKRLTSATRFTAHQQTRADLIGPAGDRRLE